MAHTPSFPCTHTAKALKSLAIGQTINFSGLFVLKKLTTRTARNGTPYMMVEAGDVSGSFVFNLFQDSSAFQVCKTLTEGSIVYLEGESDYYQERLSPKVYKLEPVALEKAEELGVLHQLIEASLEDPIALWQELLGIVESIQHPQLRSTVEFVLKEIEPGFRMSAAAISMHHAYRYGLLEHTVHMARVAQVLFPIYTEVYPDLALAGIILHDVGKVLEYETKLSIKKTRLGIMQGHVVLGYRLVRRGALQAKLSPKLTERLEHIILSHQGELEWGAAVMASTPEAVFVSMIDNLDAKMAVVQYALRQDRSAKEFSEYSPSLKASILLEDPAEPKSEE